MDLGTVTLTRNLKVVYKPRKSGTNIYTELLIDCLTKTINGNPGRVVAVCRDNMAQSLPTFVKKCFHEKVRSEDRPRQKRTTFDPDQKMHKTDRVGINTPANRFIR